MRTPVYSKPDIVKAYLKIEELLHFSQTVSACSAESLSGFRIFLTPLMLLLVKKTGISIFQTAPGFIPKEMLCRPLLDNIVLSLSVRWFCRPVCGQFFSSAFIRQSAAMLCGMAADYYSILKQPRFPAV